jgi:hypothetical protein
MNTTDNVWDEQVLWAKCKAYMDLALQQPRESWMFPFWATLSLDLLARTALSHHHPVLLASTNEPERDARHVFYAVNHMPKAKKYIPRSIDSTDVFKRCEELIDDFTSEQREVCNGMLGRRNEELHSGGAPFLDLNVQSWLPRFYECCNILLVFTGRSLDDLVGNSEAAAAIAMIQAVNDEAAKAVNGEIARHRAFWRAMSPDEQRAAASRAAIGAQRSFGHRVVCPSCGSAALVQGEEIRALANVIEEDEIVSRTVILATAMDCAGCGLTIKGHNRLHAAGMESTFTRTDRYDPVEFYGIQEPEYEPDYNE